MIDAFRARLFSLPIAVVAGLLTSWITLRAVEVEIYGYVALISTLFLLFPFADLGVGAAVVNAISLADADSENSKLNRVLVTSLRVLIASSAVLLTSALLLGWFGLWSVVLAAPVAISKEVNVIVTVSFSIFALSVPIGIGQRILLGLDRYGLAVWLGTLGPLSSLLISAVFYIASAPPLLYAVAIPAGVLTSSFVTFIVAVRVGHYNALIWANQIPKVWLFPGISIRSSAAPMIVISVGLPIALQSDRIILNYQSSATELTIYSLVAQLYAPMWTILSSTGQPLWPRFVKLRDSPEQRRSLVRKSTLTLAGLAFCLGAVLLLFGRQVIEVISSGDVVVLPSVLLAFGVLLLVQALQLPTGMLLTSPSGLRFQAWCVVVMAIVNVPLSLILSESYGAAGPAIASAIAIAGAQLIPGFVFAHARGSRWSAAEGVTY